MSPLNPDQCVLRRNKPLTSGHKLGDVYNSKGDHSLRAEEWKLCSKDMAYEARKNITEFVFCRLCGAAIKTQLGIAHGHLRTHHGISKEQYRIQFPNAPLEALAITASRLGTKSSIEQLKQQRLDRFATPKQALACVADPRWEARKKILDYIVCRSCLAKVAYLVPHLAKVHGGITKERYRQLFPEAPVISIAKNARTSGVRGRRTAEQLAKQQSTEFLAPDELAECQMDMDWEKNHDRSVSVCRVQGCGRRIAGRLSDHLKQSHGLTTPQYRAQYPGAPIQSLPALERLRKKRETNRRIAGVQKAKRKDAIALRVIELKEKGLSWTKLTIKLNQEAQEQGREENTREGYRSLARRRK